MKYFCQIFQSFFKVGLFTFGGGAAMLPLLEEEMSKFSLKQEDVMKFFSLAQALPGVIAINASTLIGHALAGVWGAFFATLGVALPSYLIIILILTFFGSMFSNSLVQVFLQGARMAVVALILSSVVTAISKTLEQRPKSIVLFMITLFLSLGLLALQTNPVFLVIGLVIYVFLMHIFQTYLHKNHQSKGLP